MRFGRQHAISVEPEADAEQQRMWTALHLVLVFVVPERAVGNLYRLDGGQIVAPGDRLGAPDMRNVIEPAVPGPIGLRCRQQAGNNDGKVDLHFVERLENTDVLELQCAVMGRLADVEAFAAGRLQLVDLLLVLRERGRGDLDARQFLEIRDHGIGQFVVPVDNAELARG
jgi:hypothetical protein